MKQTTPESTIPESEDLIPEQVNLIPIFTPSPDGSNGGHTYRLYEISTARKTLELRRDRRALLYKKYKRG